MIQLEDWINSCIEGKTPARSYFTFQLPNRKDRILYLGNKTFRSGRYSTQITNDQRKDALYKTLKLEWFTRGEVSQG